MIETAEKTAKREKPTYAGIMEEMFAKDVRKFMKAWRDAGKPHKR